MASTYTPAEALELMLGHLGFAFEIEEEDRPYGPTLHIRTSDPGRLIGRNGSTLDDIQFLLNRILSNQEDAAQRYLIDVENYRTHQYKEFLDNVQEAGEKVKATGEEIVLAPMNSFERRLVHSTFKDNPDVQSVSPEQKARLKRVTLRKRKE